MRWGAITTPAARRPGRATATAIAPGSCAARRGRSNTARRRLPTAARRSARRFARSFAGGPPSCREFFRDMRRRGLPDPLLVISDGAPGIIRALEECFPRALRQRCLAHKMRNLASKVPEDLWPEFKARAAACYQAPSPALARLLRDDVRATYGRDLPSAVACLEDDFEACIAHLRFPLGHRRVIRTTDEIDKSFSAGLLAHAGTGWACGTARAAPSVRRRHGGKEATGMRLCQRWPAATASGGCRR